MTKTDILRENLNDLFQYMDCMPTEKVISICKEAGLKFVETTVDDSTHYNEPDKATHTQIEEIDET